MESSPSSDLPIRKPLPGLKVPQRGEAVFAAVAAGCSWAVEAVAAGAAVTGVCSFACSGAVEAVAVGAAVTGVFSCSFFGDFEAIAVGVAVTGVCSFACSRAVATVALGAALTDICSIDCSWSVAVVLLAAEAGTVVGPSGCCVAATVSPGTGTGGVACATRNSPPQPSSTHTPASS